MQSSIVRAERLLKYMYKSFVPIQLLETLYKNKKDMYLKSELRESFYRRKGQ